jgi:HEAT repeat protein/S1-C subfamily serine protease
MIDFTCPSCDTELSIKDSRAGVAVKCPECGRRVTVPSPGRRIAKASAPEPERRSRPKPDDEDEIRPAHAKKDKSRKRKQMSPLTLALGLGGGSILFAVIVGGIWLWRSVRKEEPPPIVYASNTPVPRAPSAPAAQAAPTPPVAQNPFTGLPNAQPASTQKEEQLSSVAPEGEGSDEGGQSVYKHLLKSSVLILAKHPMGLAQGTGTLIDAQNRLVITNHHVAGESNEIIVFFPLYRQGKLVAGREDYGKLLQSQAQNLNRARVVAKDVRRDLALLQIDRVPQGIEALAIAKKSTEPGLAVHSMGNPGASGGLWVYTSGTVRQVYHMHWRSDQVTQHEAVVVETQSPTNPGDSGGPLVNTRGELVGVTQGSRSGAQLVSIFVDCSEATDFIEKSCREKHITWARENRSISVGGTGGSVLGMIRNLESPDSTTRGRAIEALGNAGPEAKLAVPPLIKLLGAESDAVTRRLTAKALDRIGPPEQGELNLLTTSLSNERPEVRSYAAGAIGKMGGNGRSATPALIKAAKDPDSGVRQNALRALGKVGSDSKDALLPILDNAFKDSDREVRLAAGDALASLDTLSATDLPRLQELLKNTDGGVRASAARALGQMGRQANPAIPALLDAAKGADKDVRAAAIAALLNTDAKSKDLAPVLAEALTSSDKAALKSALQAVAKFGPEAKEAVPAVALMVGDKDPELRTGAVDALVKIGPGAKGAVSALIDALQQEDKDFQIKVLAALGAIGPDAKSAVPALIRVFESRDRTIHHRCAEAIGKIGKDAIKPLIAALTHDSNFVRIGAAISLGEIGPPAKSAVRALRFRIQTDPDPQVRDVANSAIVKISSKP